MFGSYGVTDSTIFENCKRLSPSTTHVFGRNKEYSYIYYNLQCNPGGTTSQGEFNELID